CGLGQTEGWVRAVRAVLRLQYRHLPPAQADPDHVATMVVGWRDQEARPARAPDPVAQDRRVRDDRHVDGVAEPDLGPQPAGEPLQHRADVLPDARVEA